MLDKDFTRIPNNFIEKMRYLSPRQIKLFVYLCKCVNTEKSKSNDYSVFPSYEKIKEVVGLNAQSIADAKRELEALGFIDSTQRRFNKSNIYSLAGGIEDLKEFLNVLTDIKSANSQKMEGAKQRMNGKGLKALEIGTQAHRVQHSRSIETNNTKEQDSINYTNITETSDFASKDATPTSLSKEELDSLYEEMGNMFNKQ